MSDTTTNGDDIIEKARQPIEPGTRVYWISPNHEHQTADILIKIKRSVIPELVRQGIVKRMLLIGENYSYEIAVEHEGIKYNAVICEGNLYLSPYMLLRVLEQHKAQLEGRLLEVDIMVETAKKFLEIDEEGES